MSARDLAIGLLLGGGSQGENIVQYIVDNSVYVDTVPINDTYHCDMRLMFVDNRGYSFTSADKASGKTAENIQHGLRTLGAYYPLQNKSKQFTNVSAAHIIQWLVMYEDNAPIYAKSANLSWHLMDTYVTGTRTIDGVSQPVAIWTSIYDMDFQNITKGFNSLTFYKSGENYSRGKIYTDTGSTSVYVIAPHYDYYYSIAHDEYGDYPHYTNTNTSTYNLYLPDDINPDTNGSLFYTNMSVSELNQKVYDIIVAINEDIYNVQTDELVIMPPPQPT